MACSTRVRGMVVAAIIFWQADSSKTQLRLFCTSSVFYAGNSLYATNTTPCPIEFPPTCEVRVNTVQLTANLKGLKKKPGTAPPPDLGKLVKYTSSNRIDMVYLNTQSQQGVPPKVCSSLSLSRDYFIYFLCSEVLHGGNTSGGHERSGTCKRPKDQV